MHRSIAVAAVLLLLAVPAHASSPPPSSVWTVYVSVNADIEDNYAVVTVTADIRNRGPDPEFPFAVRVPSGAFVSGLTIERDGVLHRAEVAPRAAARATYEEHRAAEQTGGLVEQQRNSDVYAYLINVAEFTNVVATLTYELYVPADQGVHILPLEAPVSGFGRDLGASFQVSVVHGDGVTGMVTAPAVHTTRQGGAFIASHSVGSRPSDAATPFEVRYTVGATDGAGSVLAARNATGGSFLHRFQAPPDAQRMPLDLVLVLDTSGSMAGTKVAQLKDAAGQVIQSLRAEDRLHLVLFSSDPIQPWTGMRTTDAATRTAAVEEIEAAVAAGATGIEAALRAGLRVLPAEEGRMPIVVFLTDGLPTVGIQDSRALRAVAIDANGADARVFALAFGEDADVALVQGIARDGGGSALLVPSGAGAEVDLRRFMAALTTPVLRNVTVTYEGDVRAFQATANVLFAGSELLVAGTMGPGVERLRGTVHAVTASGPRTYAFDEPVPVRASPHLDRLVAAAKIHDLQDAMRADGTTQAGIDAVVELAMRHGFVTEHTSLVLTLAPRLRLEGMMTGTADWANAPMPPTTVAPTTWAGHATATPMPSQRYNVVTPAAPVASGSQGAAGGGGVDGDAKASDDEARDVGAGSGDETPQKVPGPALPVILALLAAVAAALGRRLR